MSERDEILASEMIAQRLSDPKFQTSVAVARNRDTGVEDELIQDMRNMNDLEIRAKYGDQGYLSSMGQYYASGEVDRINDEERTAGEKLNDAVTEATGAAIRTGGNIAGHGAGWLVERWTDGAISREQATAEIIAQHNQAVEGALQNNLTQEIQDRKRLFEIEGELDSFDNYVQYERDIENGMNPTLAAMRREGKNALDSAERAFNSPDVTGQIISQGIGDLAISAPLGGVGGLVAKGATKVMTARVLQSRVGSVMAKTLERGARASGAVAQEVSGIYAETVQDVMGLDPDILVQTSPVYRQLLEEGFSPEDAQAQLAGITAETAAIRQIPASMALAFMTARFESMPIGSFRGEGVAKGLLQIAGQGLEEAGQGISGTVNRNISVEEMANIGRAALDGVGEEAALGAIAGVGVAGVAATPATSGGTVRTARDAANALLSEGTTTDFATGETITTPSPARQAATVVGNVARPVAEAAAPLVQRGAQAAGQAATAVGGIVQDYVDRPTNKQAQESVQATVDASASLQDVASRGQLKDNVQAVYDTPDTDTVSDGFADVAGGERNLFDNVTGIVAKMGSKGFKATDADKAYAAAQLNKLQGIASSLPQDAKRAVGKLLSSKMVQKVQSDASKLDLNKEGAPTDTPTVLAVAKSNPTGVDPDATDTILEQSGEEISPEDTQVMKSASRLARIVNRFHGAKAQISRGESVNLAALSDTPSRKEKTVEGVSRQIFAEGFVTTGGTKLRSINDFAREIIAGVQSQDGTVINQQGRVIPVGDVMSDMQNFAQHMINKVTALNESIQDGYVSPEGRRGGRLKEWTSPVKGVKTDPVRYAPGNKGSLEFARTVMEEQRAVVDAFNALREEFPDQFGSFPELQVVELLPENTPIVEATAASEQPTGIEEAGGEPTSNVETEQNPTAIDEELPVGNSEEQSPEVLNVWAGTGENAQFSNLTPRPFRYNGKKYYSVEHAYQTLKSGMFDQQTYDKYGPKTKRKITGKLRAKTDDDFNVRLMERLIEESFLQNPDAAKALIDTGDAIFTHTQDKGIWKDEFPAALMEARERMKELRETGDLEITEPGSGIDQGRPGEPTTMQLYHGSGSIFDKFNKKHEGRNLQDETGVFFTNSRETADRYAKLNNLKGNKDFNTMEVLVELQNPREFNSGDEAPDVWWINNKDELAGIVDVNGHDSAIVRGNSGEIMVVTTHYDGLQILTRQRPGQDVEVIGDPTAIEGTSESRDSGGETVNDSEAGVSVSEDPESGDEEVSEQELELSEEETRELMDSPSQWSKEDRERIAARQNDMARTAREYVSEMMGPELKKRIRQLRIYPVSLGFGLGYAYVPEGFEKQKIYIREDMFDENNQLTPQGKAVLLHEAAHVVDFTNTKYSDDPSFLSQRNDFGARGNVRKEFDKLAGHSNWVDERMEYVNSFKREDPTQYRAEMFAVLSEFYYSTDGSILADSPATLSLMGEIYGERTRATGTATDNEQAVTGSDTSDTATTSTLESGDPRRSSVRVSEEFTRRFNEKTEEAPVTDLESFREGARDNPAMNQEYLAVLDEILPEFIKKMNDRLKRRVRDGKTTKSVADHIRDGRWAFRRFKAGVLMDQETGAYDQNMLELAALAVMDFVSTAAGSDPRKLEDTLERMGLNQNDLTEEGLTKVMFGLPPSQLADTLADDLKRLWHISENKETGVDDLEGVTHGFAKEIMTVLAEMDIVDIDTVQLSSDANKSDAATVLVNTQRLSDLQNRINSGKGEGVTNTVRETIFNEKRESYSIGKPISNVSRTKGRGTGLLSKMENRAVRAMQDIVHRKVQRRADLVEAVGEENIQKLAGHKDLTGITHPVLRRSVMGKNASIRKDLIEVTDLLNAMDTAGSEEVYFPVGITKVGRHQMEGPNPQSNKWMRLLVAPQVSRLSTIDPVDMRNFWLGVTQQAGLFKAEKKKHGEKLEAAKAKFYEDYGDALEMVKDLYRGNAFDSDAFTESLGSAGPELFAALEAVASWELAQENGETSFETSLSFELDGLTNGAANMMVNFGHGLLSLADFENFQRIGYFLGETGRTVTDLFENGAKDLYEVVSQTGDRMLSGDDKTLKPWQKQQRLAATRLAHYIGNFEMDENGNFLMSRDTAKNPMTKVNYGSGVQGVAVGVADDMLLKFYEKLQDLPAGSTVNEFFYPEFQADMKSLGLNVPDKPNKDFVFSNSAVEDFRKAVLFTIGKTLTNATKDTLGSRISDLNDMLVLSTNLQSKYLQKLFDKEVAELGERLAREGVIGRNKKGVPNVGTIPRKYFDELEARLAPMAPIFVSDEQTLTIGGFEKKLTELRLSSNLDEQLATPARMRRPDDVGVRALPFAVIGSGDAMMMNLIFGSGSNQTPNDVLPVFDGIDIPVGRIQEYAPFINEQVLKSWDRDVLGMAVQNYTGFLTNDLENDLLVEAWNDLMEENKKESLQYFQEPADLQRELESRLKENRARKKIFRQLAVSVDQMGGSDIGFSREGESLGLTQINARIEQEIEGTKAKKDVKTPVQETTAKALLDNMRKLTPDQKKTAEILKPLMGDVKVIFGTLDQLNEYRQENYPDDGVVLKAPSNYDFKNGVMFMSTDTNENILHEMVHAATYDKVLDHYNGNSNPAVERLETLMLEFMDIKSRGKLVNEAQAAIARRLARNNPVNNAAAVNEFMAYVLANSQVRSVAKKTNPIAKMAEEVIKLARRIMGGVPASMFDQVVFNTRVLNESTVGEGNSDGNQPPEPPDDTGGDSESTPPVERHTDYWIENLKQYIRGLTKPSKERVKVAEDVYNARKIIDSLRQSGFLSNSKDRSTFKAIYGIILSDMKLNPNGRIALNRVFNHVIEEMTPDMFAEQQTYSDLVNIMSERPDDGAAILFALSQTSKQFRNVLDQIPAPEGTDAAQGSLNEFLSRMTAFTMSKVMGELAGQDNPPKDVLDAIAKMIIDHDTDKEFRLLKHLTQSLDYADNLVSGGMSSLSDLVATKNAQVQAEARSRTVKSVSNAVTLATNLLDKTNTDLTAQAAKKVTHMGLPILSIVPIREMVSEIVGTDKQNSAVTALLNIVNSKISGMRQAYREDLPGILEREFNEPPSAEQWKSMFHTLAKTDFSLLVDLDNMQTTFKYLEDNAFRQAEITRLEQELSTKLSGVNYTDALEKAQQLSDYMNGYRTGKLLVRNAYAIVQNLEGVSDNGAVDTLDRIISLYTLERMDPQVREETVRLVQDDPKGVRSIIAYIQGLNEAEEAKPGISEQARMNAFKGYIPNEGKKNTQIIVGLESAEDDLARRGYVKLDIPYTGETDSVYPRAYYISNVRRQGAYSQGVMQNVAMTYRGVDVNTGLSVGNDTAGYISGEDSVIELIMRDQLDPNTILENEEEALMPVFNAEGDVMGFERSISNEVKDRFLGRDENLAVMLGAWAGRQVEESVADQYNKQLVDELHKVWTDREPGSDDTFEDMKRSNDPVYRESWRLIPQSTKSYIESKFEGRFMVPKAMVNLSVGYREASVTDMWSGKTRLPKVVQNGIVSVTEKVMGRKAMRWLASGEEVLQGVVSTAKDVIVVRSLVVPIANTQANMLQLMNAGVPTKQVIKGYRGKLAEVEEYVKNITKIIDLEAKQKIARGNQVQIIQDKINSLEALNKQMSIAPMIEAGQFKNLSEGITDMDVEITSGRLGDYMEKVAEKLPDTASDIAKVGLVSKSTKLYQVLNRATQYGDFLAKSILYDHLVSQGLSSEKAHAVVNEEFVNFSVLPGRVRSGLESAGLTWFMAFKIRIAKIAAKQLRDNPVRSLAINSMTDVGSPIQDNILTVIAEGRLDYATGYEMLFSAPELNPWVNLLSD